VIQKRNGELSSEPLPVCWWSNMQWMADVAEQLLWINSTAESLYFLKFEFVKPDDQSRA
jgi:hypothetical protein